MAGEISKRIGEDGESLARSVFERLGWPVSAENQNIPCQFPADHKTGERDRTQHGLDFLVAYDCPLVQSTRRNVLISMKNSELERTQGRASTVKNDLKELDWLLKCYSRSRLRSEVNENSECDEVIDLGILIKINKDPDSAESFLRNLKENERIPNTSGRDIHFIENSRFDLVDLTLKFLKSERTDYSVSYFYPSNTLNYAAETSCIEGALVPVDHFVSGPLTFRCVEGKTKEFLVFSSATFSSSEFERLVGLAFGCSQGWASRTTIVFPSLTPSERTIAKSLIRGVASYEFASSITIDSLDPRSRL